MKFFFVTLIGKRDFQRVLPHFISAGAGLPLRPGRALPFLTKRKEAKIRQGGEFRFSPPWNSLSTTKGAAFGNREKAPALVLFHAQAQPAREASA